ncbi:hypothetical protein AYO44_13965 [Planctomycetaceae bacterium SCGC AG-212-F19]|nr:hypothetical protein AYO44_13965 [Planctomycetaceae bacterium SCGC AG-212-F19]
MFDAKLLDEKVIFQSGNLSRIRRWWSGVHPERGTITRGWSGWETVEEKDHVRIRTFTVRG